MDLALKAALGAALVLVISALSRSESYYVAGLVPLFPTFALIAHWVVGTDRPPAELRETVLFGMVGVVPYLAYLACVYVLAGRMRLLPALALATGAWIVVAAPLVLAWRGR